MWLGIVLSLVFSIRNVNSRSVFAHFMVENVNIWKSLDWAREIALAQDARIDGFALNIRSDDTTADTSLDTAFSAAECQGFKLFFSFDYAGGGPWSKDRVTLLIKEYESNPAYFHHNERPFVSTFEGANNALDWDDIKAQTNCFLVPDWSSIGPKAALELNVVDGLFSWDAWPEGPNNMTTSDDTIYINHLNDDGPTNMPYMMPVSPWFFTNLPGYDKNWLWRGDNLWHDRWQQVLSFKPEFVQIISWNDYGESHYIGPLHDEQYKAFTTGKAPFNYVKNQPHDGWRALLPYLIDMYKTGNAQIAREELVAWYRLSPKDSCPDGGTTGNVANHGQTIYNPSNIVEDKIFYSALLKSPASVTVTLRGVQSSANWTDVPVNGVGIYHGSIAYSTSDVGDVVVTVSRDDSSPIILHGEPISTVCPNGVQNWNAWVGSQLQDCSDCEMVSRSASNSSCLTGSGAILQVTGTFQISTWLLLYCTALIFSVT